MKKIHQQKQIEKWLLKTIGTEKGSRISAAQKRIFEECTSDLSGKTPNQKRTLTVTIIPRIALYKAFQQDKELSAKAYDITRKYMVEVVGRQKHAGTAFMEKFPGFYAAYSKTFLKIMKRMRKKTKKHI